MPVNQHLTWVEIKDFTPGLYTNSDWLMPANASQQLVDAFPQVGGGLRAFFKGSPYTVSGIGTPSLERVIGLHARGSVNFRVPIGTGADRYLSTYYFNAAGSAGSKGKVKMYRLDESNGDTVWTELTKVGGGTLAFSSVDSNSPDKTSFRFFRQLAGSPNDQWIIAVIRYTGGDGGIYRLNYEDSPNHLVLIKMLNGTLQNAGSMAIHQARLLVAGSTDITQGNIYFSVPGDAATSETTGFLEVDPSQDLPGIMALTPSPPSDLFVLREGAAPVLVQGDLENETSQVMGAGISGNVLQDMAKMPEGYAFISPDGYIYITDGVTFTPISQQLGGIHGSSADTRGVGDLNFIEEFLFAPRGLVYHMPTKAWFTQTQMAGEFHNVDLSTRKIWGPVGLGVNFTLAELNPVPLSTASRVSEWTWQSAPLASADGRRIGMREVQLYVRSYDANATVAVTVNGVTNTQMCTSTGKQLLSFLFQTRNSVLDVTVVSTAGNAANEAPSLERARLGFEPGTNLDNSE